MSEAFGCDTGGPDVAHAHEPVIEANGAEYLVTMPGAVFVALSLRQARAIAGRMRARARAATAHVSSRAAGSGE